MRFLADALLPIVPALYGLAAVLSVLVFLGPDSRGRRAALPALLLAVSAHALEIALSAALYRRCPLGTLPEAIGITGLSLAGTYAALSLRIGRRPSGVLIVPLAFALVLASALTRRADVPVNPALKSPWFSLHVICAVLAVAALAVSFVHGVFYLLLYREIKAHRFGVLFRRLPPLAGLARMTNRASVAGFALLSVTLLAGTIYGLRSEHARSMFADPFFFVTAGAWSSTRPGSSSASSPGGAEGMPW